MMFSFSKRVVFNEDELKDSIDVMLWRNELCFGG